jgi:hypothetical protein
MAFTVLDSERLLLAHTGHEHRTTPDEAETAPPPNQEPQPESTGLPGQTTEALDESPDANDVPAAESPSELAPSNSPKLETEASAAENNSSEAQQLVPAGNAEQSQPVAEQAQILGNLGGELLFVAILTGPILLRQLRRWL